MSEQERQREQIIGRWISAVVNGGETAHPQDLHIDIIDTKWKSKSLWIEGGLKAFCIAFAIRERNHFPYTLVLNFTLSSGDKLRGINFRTLDELANQLSWTPPSLYLFEKGREPWTQKRPEFDVMIRNGGMDKELDIELFGGLVPAKKCYYAEGRWPASDDEYVRSLIIAG